MTYAATTKVPIEQTRNEIERTLARYGAKRFAYFTEAGRAIVVVFEANDRRIRFDLPVPEGDSDKENQGRRQKWRALLLCIKAKLESVESKIESFETAFLGHIVLPNGRTVAEEIQPSIATAYSEGKMLPLLPDYSARKKDGLH